jgi:hypothetical protein
MFGSKEDRIVDLTFVFEEKVNFSFILTVLTKLLKDSGNNAQCQFLHKLIELLHHNELSSFVKQINGVGMWGGSGAVWEVHIEDKSLATEFESTILDLINLMEKAKIIGKGIKPIKKLFEDNLKLN